MSGYGLDWDNLRYFLAVARAGRLTTAALRLRQDHTTVSRRIAALERSLGARLFERSPQGYRLTELGQRLMPQAELMERTAMTAHQQTRGDDLVVAGSVRIGAPDGFGSYFLARRIGSLCRQHPALQIELLAMPRVFSLSKREADIAISLARPTEGRLYARKLTDYRLGLYSTAAYLSGKPTIETPRDLQDHALIGYMDDFIFTPELDYLPLIASGASPRLRSSNLVAQLAATLSGYGICVLPSFMADHEPNLVPVLGDTVSLIRTFWLVTHADLHDLTHIRAVSDFIAQEVREAKRLFLPSPTG